MGKETTRKIYDDWVSRVCDFLEEVGPKINLPCVSFQSRPILGEQPDVVFLGYNPHESGSFDYNHNIRERFYNGNPCFYKEERDNWPIWAPLRWSYEWADYTRPIEDGHFVFFNAIYFGTNNIKEFKKIPGSNEIINKCLDFTREVILDIFKPKCVVCLSVPDCFDNLNRRFRFSEIKRIFTLQETDANLIDFAKQKKDKGWNNPYQCRRIIKKGFWNGIPVYGIPHPSGRVSNDDMGAIALYLRSEMQKLGI